MCPLSTVVSVALFLVSNATAQTDGRLLSAISSLQSVVSMAAGPTVTPTPSADLRQLIDAFSGRVTLGPKASSELLGYFSKVDEHPQGYNNADFTDVAEADSYLEVQSQLVNLENGLYDAAASRTAGTLTVNDLSSFADQLSTAPTSTGGPSSDGGGSSSSSNGGAAPTGVLASGVVAAAGVLVAAVLL